jgi:hypothetical protein
MSVTLTLIPSAMLAVIAGKPANKSLCHSPLLWGDVALGKRGRAEAEEQRSRPRIHGDAATFAEVGFGKAAA